MKKILLITTGGTIVSEKTDGGLAPLLKPDGLLKFVPELQSRYHVDIAPVMNIESPDIKPEQWCDIVKTIETHYDDYNGFVVIHGTDTLAFTASALNYMVQNSAKPIVVTGSQYPIEDTVTDGKKNLHDSCVFAAESDMPGVYVVFDGKVIRGARVKKARTKSFNAFESFNYPDAAAIIGERIIRYGDFPKPNAAPSFHYELDERVFLLKIWPGIRPADFDFVAETYKAMYIEGYGVAGLPAEIIPYIEKWQEKGLQIVIGTQASYEGTDLEVYTVGYVLSTKFGCLQSHDMTSEAVMAKMMHILGKTKDPACIKEMFLTKVGEDILVP